MATVLIVDDEPALRDALAEVVRDLGRCEHTVLEEMLIRRALARAGGNRAEAARLLNINRQLLYAKLKRYGLELSEDATDAVGEPDTEA
jgi:DNA-binding NtrC family response regulator